MSLFRSSSQVRTLVLLAPITDKPETERRMRSAILQARKKGPEAVAFAQQQAFDRAVASLVRKIPVSAEISEWFRNEKLIPQKKRSWTKSLFHPAALAVALAVAVIAGVLVHGVLERMKEFPGSETAKKMLTIAAAIRTTPMDPLEAEAGSLSDFFFMKYRLEHYDVPPEFADFRTSAGRVFDDDEGHRVAQMVAADKRMQFFLFRAERDPKNGKSHEFSGWRYVENEGWTGVVQVRNGVCFMAALRGEKKDLAPYVQAARGSPAAGAPAR